MNFKMYKKILPLLALIPMLANATTQGFETFKGFHIINKDVKTTSPLQEKIYLETNEQDHLIQYFLHLKSSAHQEIEDFKHDKNVADTHLKSNFSEIKLSIPYSKINEINDNEIIGYAPIGSYDNGWTGIRLFFERKELGICSYSFEKFVGINAEAPTVRYLINKKPSFTAIEGNYNTGFIYTLSWDEDNKTNVYDHKLECVNKNMNKDIMDNMIELAKKIDVSN